MKSSIVHAVLIPLSLALGIYVESANAETPQAQGVVRGIEEATLSSEMQGRVVRIADDGDVFHKGDVLTEFACDAHRAEEDVARASELGAKAKLENQRRLDAAKSSGQLDMALAEAQWAEAQAKVRAASAKVRLCRIIAPYDGVVLKREAKLHESVNVLTPLLRIARRGNLELTVIVPVNWLSWLKIGAPIIFAAPSTGGRGEGKVTRIGGGVDASSQTLEIRAELLSNAAWLLKSGTAGLVTFRTHGG